MLTFRQVIQGTKEDTFKAMHRYLGGLDKLAFAASQVSDQVFLIKLN